MNQVVNKLVSLFLPIKPSTGFNFDNLKSIVMFTCSRAEKVNYENTITKYPIEASGNDANSNISDNICPEPTTISINGFMSDVSSELFGNIQTAIQEQSFKIFTNPRSLEMWDALENANKKKQVFTVILGEKQFSNMFFESLEITKDQTTGETIDVSATLKQITFANRPLQVASPEKINNSTGKAYNSAVNNGVVQTEANTKIQATDSSMLYKLNNIWQ